MKTKRMIIPLTLFLASCFLSITAFAAGSAEAAASRLPQDRFSFDASASQGNVLLISGTADKNFASWEAGITPQWYSGNYDLASVYAARLSWNAASNAWDFDHQATDVKYFSSNTFLLNYNLFTDASSNGTFRLQCYSNAVEFGIGGWWEP